MFMLRYGGMMKLRMCTGYLVQSLGTKSPTRQLTRRINGGGREIGKDWQMKLVEAFKMVSSPTALIVDVWLPNFALIE